MEKREEEDKTRSDNTTDWTYWRCRSRWGSKPDYLDGNFNYSPTILQKDSKGCYNYGFHNKDGNIYVYHQLC